MKINWFKNIFKRSQKVKNDQTFLVETLIENHLIRLESHINHLQNYTALKNRWNKLLQPNIMDFIVITAVKGHELHQNPSLKSHYRNGQIFEDMLVVVGVIPALHPNEAMSFFEGGYLNALDEFSIKLDFDHNSQGLAHWIVCHENDQAGVHLTFIPSGKFMDSYGIGGVWAQDLMTLEEQKKVGLL